MMEAFFTASLALLAYAYAGYPALLAILSKGRIKEKIFPEQKPSVSLIISAFNEEAVIDEKIRNSLELDYPKDKLQIIVSSDGSTDKTCAITGKYAAEGVKLYRQNKRVGKTVMLNKAVPEAEGEVIVFSDANSIYEKDAIKKLAGNFSDPRVGCATGKIRYASRDGEPVESLYQRYENGVKEKESLIGSTVGAHGAIYAIRKRLWRPVEPSYTPDAFHPPFVVGLGYRAVYDGGAVAVEEYDDDIGREFQRRVRTIIGGLSQTPYVLKNLWRKPWFLFEYASHKIMRWATPFLLAVLLTSSILLIGHRVYQALVFLQSLFYSTAFLGLASKPLRKKSRILSFTSYFLAINLAAAAATIKYLKGERAIVWDARGGFKKQKQGLSP